MGQNGSSCEMVLGSWWDDTSWWSPKITVEGGREGWGDGRRSRAEDVHSIIYIIQLNDKLNHHHQQTVHPVILDSKVSTEAGCFSSSHSSDRLPLTYKIFKQQVGWHFIPSPRTKSWKDWMKTSFYRDYCSYCVWMLMSGRWRQVEVLLVSNKKIQQSTDDKWTTWYPTLQHLKSVKRLQEIKSCSCAQLNLILCRYLVLISGDEWALRKDPNVTNETAFPRGKMKSFKNGCRLIRRAQMGWDGEKCLMNGTTKK